jgi:hypothetical protein
VTGWYTVAVGEYASWPLSQGDYDYDYEITVRGNTGRRPVAEPALAALIACGICGVAISRRRRKAA